MAGRPSRCTRPRSRGRAEWRRAVLETGGDAALDDVTALQAAGLKGYDEELIHVSVSQGREHHDPVGVRVHETRRRAAADLVGAGIPRVRPPVAALRAALWARSDRQAALIVVMAVQQRLATSTAIEAELAKVRRDKRRRFLQVIVRAVHTVREPWVSRLRPPLPSAWDRRTQSAGGPQGAQRSVLPRRLLGPPRRGGRDRGDTSRLGRNPDRRCAPAEHADDRT